MATTPADRVFKRGNVYYYLRRVPKRFAHLDARARVKISLEKDNLAKAEQAALVVEREVQALWASLASQGGGEAWKRYEAAIERARLEGFAYRPAAEIAQAHFAEVPARLEAVASRSTTTTSAPIANSASVEH